MGLGIRSRIAAGTAVLGMALAMSGTASATPGDVHEVLPERVNLRAGPSEQDNIRTTLTEGETVIEIRREGDWVGVRSLNSGAEGWIHGDLLETVANSGLGRAGLGQGGAFTEQGAPADMDMGFRRYSSDFDNLIGSVSRQAGLGPLFESVAQGQDGALELVPTRSFLINADRNSHMLAALAVHQMLKNHQGGRPVAVRMLGLDGAEYLGVNDLGGAAQLAVQALGDAAAEASR